jgi:hypothetical protein
VDNSSVTVDEVGFGMNFFLGYAWDDRNMLVGEAKGSLYHTQEIGGTRVMQGLDALSWYHYWGMGKRRAYTVAGLGIISFATEYSNVRGRGFGYSLGVGYELFKQVQVGAYYSGGRTGYTYQGDEIKASHGLINILVTVVAY